MSARGNRPGRPLPPAGSRPTDERRADGDADSAHEDPSGGNGAGDAQPHDDPHGNGAVDAGHHVATGENGVDSEPHDETREIRLGDGEAVGTASVPQAGEPDQVADGQPPSPSEPHTPDAPVTRRSRWQRRARTREARLALAKSPTELAEPRPELAGRGDGAAPEPPAPTAAGRRPRLKKLRVALVLLGLAILAFVAWVFGIMMAVAQDLPDLENRAQFAAAENSVVLDSDGRQIATLTNNEGRILVDSAEIAATMKDAVVAIEDERFYEHRGVDVLGIARALSQDILSGSAQQGASTITQQFVKNALQAQDSRTIFQKLRESALAYHMERQWSKDKILTEYLNSIYFGEGAFGIEAAARTFFGSEHPGCGEEGAETCASQLLPWEAAMIAGLISSPNAYSPRANPEAALERRNLVLQKMDELGYISAEEYAEYSEQPIPKASDLQPPEEDSKAPYFTSWLRQQLVDKFGAGEAFGGGLEVTSTLDLELQRAVEGIVDSRLSGIEPTGAVVVLENETAAVRAMVGGSDFEQAPFNLATQGRRQPGSAFKPFTLVTALEQGRSPDEVFASEPKRIPYTVRVSEDGSTEQIPDVFDVNNYEDSYVGSADLATATTLSDNSVYAELGTQVGVHNVAATANEMGVETDLSAANDYRVGDGDYHPYNPALILGGLELGVTPLEMAHAFGTLAAGGRRISGTMAASPGGPVAIQDVRDSDGEFAELETGDPSENDIRAEPVISADVAQTATSILETVVTSGTGTNAATGEPTWGKTGTTDDNGDAWFCGATSEITTCVWVGHAKSNEPMLTEYAGAPVDGGTIPALIFHDVVLAHTELADSDE